MIKVNDLAVRKIDDNNTNDNDNDNTNDNDDKNVNTIEILLNLLQIGVIFEYLRTNGIINLLCSSSLLLCFEDIPLKIFDRVLLESFQTNNSLTLCKLINHPSSLSKMREVLVAKPATPLTLYDLKAGYETMQKIECCFSINLSCRNLDNHERTITDIGDKNKKLISVSDQVDHGIVITHFAVKTRDGESHFTMQPFYCSGCKRNHCACIINHKCHDCKKRYCINSSYIYRCCDCHDFVCYGCSEPDYCHDCEELMCGRCDNGDGLCENCMENYDY